MDLNQLKSFVAVAHQQNLTQAAETLHLSQPAVSAQIKALEKHLDVQLFERNAQGMSLTASGKLLLPEAEDMLQQMHRFDAFATSIKDEYHLQADIGVIQMLPAQVLSDCIGLLKQHHPHIHQRFSLGLSGIILNQVRRKELQGGFFVGDNPYRNLHVIDIMPLEFEVVMPSSWQNKYANSSDAMHHLPWISLSAFSALTKFEQKIWRQWKIKPTTALQCDDMHVLLTLVQEEHGLALLPTHYLNAHATSGVYRLPDIHLSEMLSFIYPIELELDPVISAWRMVLNEVKTLAEQMSPSV